MGLFDAFKKGKTVKVPVTEEGVIRRESIYDAESLMLAFRVLIQWAQDSKKQGWKNQERFPVAVFVVNMHPDDYHGMKLQPNKEKHQVRMSMLAFVNAFTPGELDETMKDVVRAYNRNALNQIKNNAK